MEFSSVVRQLKPSATIAAAAQAKALKNQGVTVYEFTLGEPDFTTPDHICEAATAAMKAGYTHYTPATGIAELKQAICDFYQREYQLSCKPDQVAISNGAKHSLHNVLTALCEPGDEVIIPAPYWVSYSALVELTGATPVIIDTTEESGFCLSAEQLEAAITDKTKLLMLNNPCNPTGAAYPVETLRQLAKVVVERNILIISDEIYEKLIYEGSTFQCFATLNPAVLEKTILVSGVSKAYAMTGWRIGWTVTTPELTAAMTRLQSQETSNPCSISQYAAIAALNGPQDCVSEMQHAFAERREYVLQRLDALSNISYAKPGGAFYAFFNISQHFGRPLGSGITVSNSTEFCEALLKHAHVALVTGDAFGAPGYVRLSFATDLETIQNGFDRIQEFLA